jgi:RNA polymerase sigma-B factor
VDPVDDNQAIELEECAGRSSQDAQTAALLARRQHSVDEVVQRRLLRQAIELNVAFARSIAQRFCGRHVDLDDLEQIALLALTRAAQRYRPEGSTPFTAYAAPSISGEIRRHFRDSTELVRVPRRLQELHAAIDAVLPSLEQELARTPVSTDLAKALGEKVEDVLEAMTAARCADVVPLGRSSLREHREVTRAATIEEDPAFGQLEAAETVRAALAGLTDRQRRIMQLRYLHEQTQTEIAKEVRLSQIQVSRILTSTLKMLHEQLASA